MEKVRAEGKLRQLSDHLKAVKDARDAALSDLEELHKTAAESRAAALAEEGRAQMDKANASVDESKRSVEAAESQSAQLQQQLDTTRAELDRVGATMKQKKQLLAAAKDQYTQLQRYATGLQQQLDTSTADHKKTGILLTQEREVTAAARANETKLKHTLAEYERKADQAKELEQQLHVAEGTLARQKQIASTVSAPVQQLEDRLADRGQITVKKLANLQAELHKARAAHQTDARSITLHEQAGQKAQGQIDQLQRQLHAATQAGAASDKDRDQLTRTLNDIENEHAQVQTRCDTLETTHRSLDAELRQLVSQHNPDLAASEGVGWEQMISELKEYSQTRDETETKAAWMIIEMQQEQEMFLDLTAKQAATSKKLLAQVLEIPTIVREAKLAVEAQHLLDWYANCRKRKGLHEDDAASKRQPGPAEDTPSSAGL